MWNKVKSYLIAFLAALVLLFIGVLIHGAIDGTVLVLRLSGLSELSAKGLVVLLIVVALTIFAHRSLRMGDSDERHT